MRLSTILLIISLPFADSYIKKNGYNNYLMKKCNNFAFKKTKNQDVYDCLKKTNNKCNHLENYNEFNKYQIECLKNVSSNKASIDVIIYLVIWITITLLFYTF